MAQVAVKLTETLRKVGHSVAPRRVAPALEVADIQGLVLRGYGGLPHATYLLLQVREAAEARRFIGRLLPSISGGEPRDREQAVQIAFTYAGLAALGVPFEALRGFSREFIGGMTGEHRSRFLGDTDESDPCRWDWGAPGNPNVHALLMLHAQTAAALRKLYEETHEALSADGWSEVHRLLASEPLGREHFGFADGVSQPSVDGYHEASSDLHRIRAGEFVLGYENEYDLFTERPLVAPEVAGAAVLPRDPEGSGQADLGKNGTYLVLRQLRQDVVRFRETLDALTCHADGSSNPEARDRLAAQMVGRWPSGASLIESPWRDDPSKAKANDFRYQRVDPDGLLCPVGAHVRRANPRDTLAPDPGTDRSLAVNRRHRLLRRGRPYGAPLEPGAVDDLDRGLLFIGVCANISRQFEFIQHSWLMDPRFNGMSGEADPLIGAIDDNHFVVPDNPVRKRCSGLPRFVTVRGGAYFFLPGMRALRFVSELS